MRRWHPRQRFVVARRGDNHLLPTVAAVTFVHGAGRLRRCAVLCQRRIFVRNRARVPAPRGSVGFRSVRGGFEQHLGQHVLVARAERAAIDGTVSLQHGVGVFLKLLWSIAAGGSAHHPLPGDRVLPELGGVGHEERGIGENRGEGSIAPGKEVCDGIGATRKFAWQSNVAWQSNISQQGKVATRSNIAMHRVAPSTFQTRQTARHSQAVNVRFVEIETAICTDVVP